MPATPQTDRIIAALTATVEKAAKALILEIDANLKRPPSLGGTPVDTNHARASWIPSVGSPSAVEASGSSSAAHDAGVAAVLTYKIEDGALYVSNNAGYIGRLNLGSSTQAPAGFVEACIDQAVAAVKQRFGVDFEVKTTGVGTFADQAGGYAAENLAGAYSPFGDE